MGYELEQFTNKDSINQELICPICLCVLEDPVMVEKCQHTFCSSCINTWHQTSKTCPVDRDHIAELKLKPAPRMVVNMLNDLPRKCRDGCSKVFKLGDTAAHENSCEKKPGAMKGCTHKCGAMLKDTDVPTHDCIVYLREMLLSKKWDPEMEKMQDDPRFPDNLKIAFLEETLEVARIENARLRSKLSKLEDCQTNPERDGMNLNSVDSTGDTTGDDYSKETLRNTTNFQYNKNNPRGTPGDGRLPRGDGGKGGEFRHPRGQHEQGRRFPGPRQNGGHGFRQQGPQPRFTGPRQGGPHNGRGHNTYNRSGQNSFNEKGPGGADSQSDDRRPAKRGRFSDDHENQGLGY